MTPEQYSHLREGLALLEGMMRFCVTSEGNGIVVRFDDLRELRDRFDAVLALDTAPSEAPREESAT